MFFTFLMLGTNYHISFFQVAILVFFSFSVFVLFGYDRKKEQEDEKIIHVRWSKID